MPDSPKGSPLFGTSAARPDAASHQVASFWSWPSLRRRYHAAPAPVQRADAVIVALRGRRHHA
jgi:hypothetical protein